MGTKTAHYRALMVVVLGIILFRILPTRGIKCYSCSVTSGPSCQQPSGPVLVDCDKEPVKMSPEKVNDTNAVLPYDHCTILESADEFNEEGNRLLLSMGCTTKFHVEYLLSMSGVQYCGRGISFSECIGFPERLMWICSGDGCNNGPKSTGSSKIPCSGDDCDNGQKATGILEVPCSGDECNNGRKATGISDTLCLVGVIFSRILIYFM